MATYRNRIIAALAFGISALMAVPLDTPVTNAIRAVRAPLADGIVRALTESHGAFLALALVAAALMWRRKREHILPFLGSIAVAKALGEGLKLGIARVRPFETLGFDPLYHVSSSSFPSNHAFAAFAGAVVAAEAFPRHRALIFCIAAAFPLMRLYAGVHWLSDILAGAALGTLLGVLALAARPKPQHLV